MQPVHLDWNFKLAKILWAFSYSAESQLSLNVISTPQKEVSLIRTTNGTAS